MRGASLGLFDWGWDFCHDSRPAASVFLGGFGGQVVLTEAQVVQVADEQVQGIVVDAVVAAVTPVFHVQDMRFPHVVQVPGHSTHQELFPCFRDNFLGGQRFSPEGIEHLHSQRAAQ